MLKTLRRHSVTARERALAHRLAALLLDYPDPELVADLPRLREAVRELPHPLRADLLGTVDHVEGTPLAQLTEEYVATFDLRRRCCPYLTYYSYGDTRNRGAALIAFSAAYRRAGFVPADGELPDHLCVVLEFSATVAPDAGALLLLQYRAGLELLHLALHECGSPYVGAVSAVSATLPPLSGRLTDAVARLAAEGPPGEQVGLAPFAPPDTGKTYS